MAHMVNCVKLGREGEGVAHPEGYVAPETKAE